MRTCNLLLLILTAITTTAQAANTQYDYERWKEEAQYNKRLLPRYGHIPKSEGELKADSIFIANVKLDGFTNLAQCAHDHVLRGFRYLNRGEIRTAMYRFNQSYLIDSTQAYDYWGYGAVYLAMQQVDLAKEQYETGLEINPQNSYIWTDLGTIYTIKFDNSNNHSFLDTAINYFSRAYEIDSANANTTYKLSAAYFRKQDCANALKYFKKTETLSDRFSNAQYVSLLEEYCKGEK